MKLLWLAVAVVGMVGCSNQFTPPTVMQHTHKFWSSDDYMSYESDDGFGCGHIQRVANGRVFMAFVINWNRNAHNDMETNWNSLGEAEAWIERWCKP